MRSSDDENTSIPRQDRVELIVNILFHPDHWQRIQPLLAPCSPSPTADQSLPSRHRIRTGQEADSWPVYVVLHGIYRSPREAVVLWTLHFIATRGARKQDHDGVLADVHTSPSPWSNFTETKQRCEQKIHVIKPKLLHSYRAKLPLR